MIAAALLLAAAVHGQNAWDVKGVHIGDTMETFKRDVYQSGWTTRFGGRCAEVAQQKNIIACTQRTTFAKIPSQLRVEFVDNQVVGVEVSIFNAQMFDAVLAAMIEKYGDPSATSNEPVSNAIGAEFSNRITQWHSTEGATLCASERSENVDTSRVVMRSPDYEQLVGPAIQADAKRRAKDL